MSCSTSNPTRGSWQAALGATTFAVAMLRSALAAFSVAAITWLSAGPMVWASRPGVISPIDRGQAVPVEAFDERAEIRSGRSATVFSLRLPEGASCPGDSVHDQWRVQSFIVPATDDPGSLRYGVIGPEGAGQYALYQVDTRPLTDGLTQQNLRQGEPGVISSVPPLSFAVFPPGTLPSGRYRIGIACTYFRDTADYWDIEVVLTAAPDDEPGQLVWRLATAPQDLPSRDDESVGWFTPTFGAIGGIGVIALVWAVRRLAVGRPATLTKEPQ